MNEENLIPFKKGEQRQKDLGKMGGIASGESKRERKKLKEALLVALDIKKGDKTVQQIGVEALLDKFMSGDIQAFTTVRDTIGEKPIDKVEQEVVSKIRVDLEDE